MQKTADQLAKTQAPDIMWNHSTNNLVTFLQNYSKQKNNGWPKWIDKKTRRVTPTSARTMAHFDHKEETVITTMSVIKD